MLGISLAFQRCLAECRAKPLEADSGDSALGNAIWLFLSTPYWFFSFLGVVLKPDAFVFGLISWSGTIGLLAGVLLGIRGRHSRLLWFAISPLLSQLLVVAAGLARGQVPGDPASWINGAFLVMQAGFLAFLVFRFRGLRAPAISLAVFGLSYALFAAFIAGMAFTDDWL